MEAKDFPLDRSPLIENQSATRHQQRHNSMSTNYHTDSDLDFIQYCSEEQLRILARYLTHDKDGDKRVSSMLLENDYFKRMGGQPDQYRRSWDLIAGELQHFGGDSIVNLFRRRGVTYREILADVCDKLSIKVGKNASAYEAENDLLAKLVADSWEKMPESDRKKLLEQAGIDSSLKGAAALLAVQTALQTSKILSYNIAVIVASHTARILAGSVVTTVAGQGALRGLAVLAGPIGWALTGALAIPAISGTAYRVTIPAVIQIASMRREMAQQDRF
jgi:uncharacterized protein YaaW (UPF0174 family)